MKTKLLTFSLSILCLSLSAQVSFKKAKSLINPRPNSEMPFQMTLMVMGTMISSQVLFSLENGGIYLYKNDGNGNFNESEVIDEVRSAYVMHMADIDGDSKKDLICLSYIELWVIGIPGMDLDLPRAFTL